MDMRRSWGQLSLFLLALVGVAISIYLTAVHYENVPLVCSTRGLFNCELVLSSQFSVVPGTTIPVSLPGLLWFLTFAVLSFLGWRVWPQRRSVLILECILAVSGLLTILYLVYIEIVRLHTFCAWCTALHGTILTMLIITLVQLQQVQEDVEDEIEEEKVMLKR